MKIRNAELCDLPYLLEMLENAKASLRALGIDQWQNGYPNETTLREDIQNKICRVVIDDENNILASAAVYVGDEPTYHEIYNGAWQTENKIYGIVHRIMAANNAKRVSPPCDAIRIPATSSCSTRSKKTVTFAAASFTLRTAQTALPTKKF